MSCRVEIGGGVGGFVAESGQGSTREEYMITDLLIESIRIHIIYPLHSPHAHTCLTFTFRNPHPLSPSPILYVYMYIYGTNVPLFRPSDGSKQGKSQASKAQHTKRRAREWDQTQGPTFSPGRRKQARQQAKQSTRSDERESGTGPKVKLTQGRAGTRHMTYKRDKSYDLQTGRVICEFVIYNSHHNATANTGRTRLLQRAGPISLTASPLPLPRTRPPIHKPTRRPSHPPTESPLPTPSKKPSPDPR